MIKIKWKRCVLTGDVSAQIGNVYLCCWQWKKPKTIDCFASVNICGIANTRRRGPWRKSVAKAKEDAIRIAHELLQDCRVAIDRETKLLTRMEN